MEAINQPSENVEDISPIIPNVEVKISTKQGIFACAIACVGAVIFGVTMGYSSPAVADLQKNSDQGGLGISDEQASWFGSLVTVGALTGGPLASLVVDKLGRKYTVMLSTLPFCLGWLLIIVARNFLLLCLGRVFTGIGTGMCSLSVPTYIAEISPPNLRGMLGAGFQLSVTIGVLIIYGLGISLNYKWLAVVSSAITLVHVFTMSFMPEALKKTESSRETETIEKIDKEDDKNKIKIQDICAYPTIYKPLLIIVLTMVFQQFSGINAVIFYSESIFHGAGFENQGSIPSIILATIQVVMTFVSCLIVDKLGRKVLLIIAGSLMAFTSVTFSLYYFLTDKGVIDDNDWYSKALSLGSLGLYISAFSIGWGPIPWLYMAEILPLKARGTCSGIATSVNWICAFLVTKFFSNLQKAIHSYGTFWLFASVNVAGVIFVALVLRETKGRSLEEIERYYSSKDGYENLRNKDDSNE